MTTLNEDSIKKLKNLQPSLMDTYRKTLKNDNKYQIPIQTYPPVIKSELLHAAIYYENIATVKDILNSDFNIKLVPKTLSTLEEENKLDESVKNYFETPFIIQAAMRGNYEIVQLLIEKGSALTEEGPAFQTPKRYNWAITNAFGAAVYYGHYKLVGFLINRYTNEEIGLDKEISEKLGKSKGTLIKEVTSYTPLTVAVMRGHNEIIEELLKKSANIKKLDMNKNNLLHIAANHNKSKTFELLAKKFPEMLQERNNEGKTPYGMAIEFKLMTQKELSILLPTNSINGLDILLLKEQKLAEKKEKKKLRKKQQKEKQKKSEVQ